MEPEGYDLAEVDGRQKPLDANFALDPSRLYEALPLPADSKCTRVIHIPHEKDPDAALVGSLQIVNLQDSPLYAALSYVWGTYSPVKDTIECNGINIPITTNCRDAIVSLRARLVEGLTIWIDAICINQNDEREKASQIRLISEIYTWASEVYIWLGHGDQKKYQAMKCLRRASSLREHLAGIPWHDRGSPPVSRIFRNPRIKKCFSHLSWAMVAPFRPLLLRGLGDLFDSTSLECLMRSQWIDRAWTLQEAVLASNPTVVCGHETISWSHIIQGVDHLYLYGAKTPPAWAASPSHLLKRIRDTFIGRPIDRVRPQLPLVSGASRTVPSFEKWRALSNIWLHSQRPIHWNGKKFKYLGAREAHVGSARQTCSAWDYYQEIKGSRIIVSALIVFCYMVLAGSLCAGFSAIGVAITDEGFRKRRKAGPLPTKQDLVLAICSLALSIVGTLYTTVLVTNVIMKTWFSDEYAADGALNGVLRSLRERQATIPKDKAFALSSVLYSLDIAHAKVDYEMSLGEVYHRLFLDLLRYQPAVINLLVDVKQTYFPGLPSWVPDWSTVQQRHWLKPELIYGHVDKYQKSLPSPQMTINERKLGLWSILEGTVAVRTTALTDWEKTDGEERQGQTQMLKVLWVFLAQAQHLLPDADPPICLATEIARVVTECVPELDEQHTAALTKCLKACNQSTEQQDGADEPSLSELLRDLQTNHLNNLNLSLTCCGQLLRSDSCLFLTIQGSVGFGPIHTEKGDTIALLRGVAVPMLLRPAEAEQGNHNTFSVIGPAYIEKHMDLSEFNAGVHGADWVAVYLV